MNTCNAHTHTYKMHSVENGLKRSQPRLTVLHSYYLRWAQNYGVWDMNHQIVILSIRKFARSKLFAGERKIPLFFFFFFEGGAKDTLEVPTSIPIILSVNTLNVSKMLLSTFVLFLFLFYLSTLCKHCTSNHIL